MKTVIALCVPLVLLCAVPNTARADVYTWTDDEGVIHFTNIPQDPRARPVRRDDRTNTFDWRDGLGAMRRVHRVDVTEFDPHILDAARYYSLPAALVKAVVAAESAFEPAAVSTAGAQGLMQLMPRTAREMQVGDPFDPRANVFGGARYLRLMANRFGGDIRLAAAAYNAGPEAVERAGGVVPDIAETRTYVQRVLKLYTYYLGTMR